METDVLKHAFGSGSRHNKASVGRFPAGSAVATRWIAVILLLLLPLGWAVGGCGASTKAGPSVETVTAAADRLAGWLRQSITHEGSEQDEFLAVMDNLYDWPEIGLVRYDGDGFADYLTLTERYVRESWRDPDGFRKATDLERLTLAVSAAGGDAHSVGGCDLIAALCSHARFDMQGVNSPIFGLIALDCGGYQVPAEATWTRESMLRLILEYQNDDGSFDLKGSGKGDPDITAMAIQALWRYVDRAEVEETVRGAVAWLSEAQREGGGYASWGTVNSESASQVIIALSTLGIDAASDPDFDKEGEDPLSSLLTHQLADGSFCHVSGGDGDKMASEQAMLALTSWLRFQSGRPALYDYVDQ